MSKNQPIYMIVGLRPCKIVDDENNVSQYLAWDWKKKEFADDFDFVYAALNGRKPEDPVEYADNIRRVSEYELFGLVEAIRAGRDLQSFTT